MAVIYFKEVTSLGSKRAAMKKQRELKERGYTTKLVKKEGQSKPVWGVDYH